MCRKGWAAGELLSAGDRLTTPLMRIQNGALTRVGWERAIEEIGNRLERLQAESGNDAVGVFGGGGLTNETAYMLGKFARAVLRTKHIDYNGRFCMAAAASANQRAFGVDRGLPFPVADLAGAEVILLVGANPAETMPPLMQYLDAQKSAGGHMILVDPRRTPTAAYATQHLQLRPGTDAALANGLLHVLLGEGFADTEFIQRRTADFDKAKHVAAQYWPDRVERITGVPVAALLTAARALGNAKSVCILTARGVEQQSHGVENVLAFINLSLALGQVGKPHSGFGCITGQGNGQGGREHGQKADQLPGYRSITNEEDRLTIAKAWRMDVEDLPGPGPSACELIDSIGQAGGVRGLIVMGSNPLVSAPDAQHVARQLSALDTLIVADSFLSETAAMADFVLPVCQWAEFGGTMTNLEGRLLLREPAVLPPADVFTDLEVLERIATRLGNGRFIRSDPEQVFQELARVSSGGLADYSGFSFERLRRGEELFWPCPGPNHPGTPRLFTDSFPTQDGRARFHGIVYFESLEQVSEEFPFLLTTGRLLAHYQTGTQTHRVPSLETAEPRPHVEMHPQLAATLGIADGDWAMLRTRRGRLTLRVRLSDAQRLDTVFVPFHWAHINDLTSRLLDPKSKIPEFKLSAVAIERVAAAPRLSAIPGHLPVVNNKPDPSL